MKTVANDNFSRRQFLGTLSISTFFALVSNTGIAMETVAPDQTSDWRAGIGRRVITPQIPVWLAGFGFKREATGTIHDIWVKALAVQDKKGKKAVK